MGLILVGGLYIDTNSVLQGLLQFLVLTGSMGGLAVLGMRSCFNHKENATKP